jgi:hypothetical protein
MVTFELFCPLLHIRCVQRNIESLVRGWLTFCFPLRLREKQHQSFSPLFLTRRLRDRKKRRRTGQTAFDLFRRAASYVDRIPKDAKPAELPAEQPTKFEVVINLKTAKQIGLALPPSVLARADRVIK